MSLEKYVIRSVPTYEEFLKSHIKYDGDTKCFVFDCNKPGLYEGGDARFYCGMCEEHSGIRNHYRTYLRSLISDSEYMLSNEQLYDAAKAKQEVLVKKLNDALEEEYGPKFSQT